MGRADLLKFPLLCEGKVDFVAIFETGRSEANGPMMAILMPSWFQQRFPVAMRNLKVGVMRTIRSKRNGS